jgi:hypothetical protein
VKVARRVRRAAWGNGPAATPAPRPRPTQPSARLVRRRPHRPRQPGTRVPPPSPPAAHPEWRLASRALPRPPAHLRAPTVDRPRATPSPQPLPPANIARETRHEATAATARPAAAIHAAVTARPAAVAHAAVAASPAAAAHAAAIHAATSHTAAAHSIAASCPRPTPARPTPPRPAPPRPAPPRAALRVRPARSTPRAHGSATREPQRKAAGAAIGRPRLRSIR